MFSTCTRRLCLAPEQHGVHVFVLAFSILTKCIVFYLRFPYLCFPILAISAPPKTAKQKGGDALRLGSNDGGGYRPYGSCVVDR